MQQKISLFFTFARSDIPLQYGYVRLASLSPAVTEILFALGKGKDIVCRDQFSNAPDEAKNIPALSGHQKIDSAALRTHEPDLVFTSTVIQRDLAEKLRAQDIQTIHQDPRSLFDVYNTILELGVLLQCEELAHALSQKMREEMNSVKKKTQVLPRRPRVYIEEWHNPPMASGNWVPEIVRLAGGEPFPIPAGELSREASLEEVQAFDPEIIVLSICGAGALAQKTLVTERLEWQDLPAVRDNYVYVIDDALLNRPGPRLSEGAQRLYSWIFEYLH